MTFDELYETFRDDVEAVALAVAGPELAEDGAQEAFARLFAHLEQAEAADDRRAWVRAVARNACLNVVDRYRRRTSLDLTMAPGELAVVAGARPLASGAGALDPAELVERRDSLARAFGAVLPSERRVLVDRLVTGLTYEELGERTGATANAMRSSLKRGRRRFAAAWLEQLGQAAAWRFRRATQRFRELVARHASWFEACTHAAMAGADRQLAAVVAAVGLLVGGGGADEPRRAATDVGRPMTGRIAARDGGTVLAPSSHATGAAASPRTGRRIAASAAISPSNGTGSAVSGKAQIARPNENSGALTFRVHVDTPAGPLHDDITADGYRCGGRGESNQVVCRAADVFNEVAERD